MPRKISDETLKFNVVINGNEGQREYNKLTRANKKLLEANEDLEKQAKKLRRSNKANADELAALEKQIQENNATIKENSDRMSDLTKEIGLSNLTMKQLKKEARDLQRTLDNLDPNDNNFKELSQQLVQVKNRMTELKAETNATIDSLEDNLGTLENFGAGIGNLFVGFKRGDAKQVQDGLRGIASGFHGARKAALAFISTPVGAFLAIVAGIGAIAREFVIYNESIRESALLTEQLTGSTGQAADDIRVRAQALTDTFGGDFNENLKDAKVLVNEFGVSYEKAFDIIEEGLIRGGKANDEFLESIEEYSTFFSNAGFSANEFRKILNTGVDLSIYKDKLPDAIKEFDLSIREQTDSTKEALINAYGKTFTDALLKRVREGKITTKEALAEIAKESQRTGTTIQQNAQLTADLFRGAGEDAGGALKIFEAVNIALGDQERALTPLQEQLQRVADANEELAKAQDDALKSDDYIEFSNNVSLFWTKVKTLFFNGVSFILTKFNEVQNFTLKFFFQTIATIKVLPTVVREAFSSMVTEAGEAIKSLFSFGQIFERLLNLDFEGAKEAFKDYTANVKSEFGDVGNVVGEAIDKIQAVRKAVGDAVDADLARQREGAVLASGIEDQETNNGSGNENDKEDELSAEDKRRLESRKRLYEMLDALEAERELIEKQKQVDDITAKQLEEEAALQEKFAKLEADANGETELLAGFEEEKQFRLQEIRDKYDKLRSERDATRKKEFLEKEQKFKGKLAEAEENLQKARAAALNSGLNALRSFFGESSKIGKAIFLLQQGMAVNEVLITTAKSIAQAKAADAAIPAVIPPGFINPFKVISTSTMLKNVAAAKFTAASQIASILSATVEGFEDGLYPVTRTDGRRFKASIGGDPRTQIVDRPTLFNGPFLAGEAGRSQPEMIIDGNTFNRLDPRVIDYILQTAGKVRGFQSGFTSERAQSVADVTTPEPDNETSMTDIMIATFDLLVDLKENGIDARSIIGDDKIQELDERKEQLETTRDKAKR